MYVRMPIAMRRLQQNDSIHAYDGLKNRSSNGPSFYTSLKSPCFPFCSSIVSLLGILCLQFHRRVYVYRMSVRPSNRRLFISSSSLFFLLVLLFLVRMTLCLPSALHQLGFGYTARSAVVLMWRAVPSSTANQPMTVRARR